MINFHGATLLRILSLPCPRSNHRKELPHPPLLPPIVMKSSEVVFMAVVLALAFGLAAASLEKGSKARGSAADGGNDLEMASRQSRFLASLQARTISCTRNPLSCRRPGSAGPDCCGGQCVDMGSDVFNCGQCGHVCKFTEACCKGKCVDLSFDKRHCGSCFNKCKRGVLCIYGMCNYA